MECFNCGQSGHMARQCSWNREITSELAAQFARCPKCPAIIYAWDKGIPCERHRIVAEWRAHYHSPRVVLA